MTNAGGTVPVRVIRAVGTIAIAEAVQRATEAATAGRCHVVAGIVFIGHRPSAQHGGWQFSLSHWGRPPVVLSRHRLKQHVGVQVARVRRALRERDLSDAAAFAALIQELAAFGDREAGSTG